MSRLVIDLDGVCYEWDRTARYMLRTYKGYDWMVVPSTDWWSIKDSIAPADWDWLWTEGVKRGLFRYGHMVKDTRWALEQLSQKHTITIATSRPPTAVNDTAEWVALYFKDIPLEGLHIGENKADLPGDVLIDDRPSNIQEWNKTGRNALIFDQPWNELVPSCSEICSGTALDNWGLGHKWRVKGWKDVVRHVEWV